jgi:hypothetical protein
VIAADRTERVGRSGPWRAPAVVLSLAAAARLSIGTPGLAWAGDHSTRIRDFPCAGCVTDLPPGEAAVPLLVVLHGDEGTPVPVALPRWARTAEQAGYALLAPRCPRDQGCRDGSWWRWSGDPAWLGDQIEKVRARRPLDGVYVVGWSGGSSYLGHVAPQWKGFDGVALCGGGMPPSVPGCLACPPPVYFVAGSGNPLHGLEVESRDYFLGCQHEVKWDFLPGKDHGGELESLTPERTRGILTWLREHRRSCAPAASPAAPSASSSPAPPGSISPAISLEPRAAEPAPSAPSMAPPASPPVSRCACGVPGRHQEAQGPTFLLLSALLGLGAARAQRRGRGAARVAGRRKIQRPAASAASDTAAQVRPQNQ